MSLISAEDIDSLIFATPETVDEVVATFPRTAATPADVRDLLDVAHKLFRTSMIHYELAAIAAEKSLQALERATRIRLGVAERVPFVQLIDRLAKEAALGDEDRDILDTGRQIRNAFAHPRTASLIPLVMVTNMLRTSFHLIARLFPDR